MNTQLGAQIVAHGNGHGNDARGVGTVRAIDDLGRVVVPAELRRMVGLHARDLVDFRLVDGSIAISKVWPECVLCGSSHDLAAWNGKKICDDCIRNIRKEDLSPT